ncbi:hypothetical protein WJX74_000858 [Apatococcus lobatus]|uniref:Uncharacterized protein n=1 Tax=Apatococcus lobatus TaxID=904363 RepID=A0AAW1RBQ0_9CHLO
MHPLSFRSREQAGGQWKTVASYTHLFKQFKGITFKSYQVLRNHLSKLPPGGQLSGTFEHIESGKTVQLDVRFPAGSENCKKPSWRTGPGAKRVQGASTIVRQPSDPQAAPQPVLERFAVVEKEQLNPDVNEKLQHQSQYAAAGYAHTFWAHLGVSQEEFQAKRDRFGPVREAGFCRSKKDCQFIEEWQNFCTFEGFKLADGKTDYAFARPLNLRAMDPDRNINYGLFVGRPEFQLPSGELNYAGIKQLVTADYDSRVIEFFTRWVTTHWEQKSILNTFQKCRRVLSRLAALQGWYGLYKSRTTKSNGQEMRGVLYDLDCLTELDERIRLELATRSQR